MNLSVRSVAEREGEQVLETGLNLPQEKTGVLLRMSREKAGQVGQDLPEKKITGKARSCSSCH